VKYRFVHKPPVLYPLLFAIFPILFLFAHNIGEVTANQLLLPIMVSIGFTLLLWAMLSLICRDVLKGGLATSLFLLFFFFYGRFYELLERWKAFVPQHEVLFFEIILLWGFCVYCIKIVRKDFKNITKILNMVTFILIIIPVITIAFHEIRQARSSSSEMYEQQSAVAAKPSKLNGIPDIYYVVLDEYAHPAIMKEYYNYDNSQFISNLENKGFFFAQGSRTRTALTFFSLASTLNMKYYTGETEFNMKDIYPKIAKNRVAEYLRSIGYKYICFGSWADIGKYDTGADLYYNFYLDNEGGLFSRAQAGEFNYILLNTTMLRSVYFYLMRTSYRSLYRACTMGTIEQLKKIPSMKGPKFTFAHIMCPHVPFVFGPAGEHINYANWYNYEDKQFYRGQYIFITREIEKMVDALLRNSATKPIIIIQSDHGIRQYSSEAWRKIFNAYYLPRGGGKYLYKNISPVNTFRVILNHYFGAKYKLLED
jgi:hypothetical protein